MRLIWLIRAWISTAIKETNRALPVLGRFAVPDVGATAFVALVVAPWLFLLIAVVFPGFAGQQSAGLVIGIGLVALTITFDRFARGSASRVLAEDWVRKTRERMTDIERRVADFILFPLIVGIMVIEVLIVRWILI